jgi:hypothetical protein
VDKEIFEAGHRKQEHGVCVLMSYAVAAYPHTHTPAREYMMAYCREFNHRFATPEDAERLVAQKFDEDRAAGNRPSGYAHLEYLHKQARDAVFAMAKSAFDILPLEAERVMEALQATLKMRPQSTAVVCQLTKNQPAHSVAVAFDASINSFLVSDPKFPTLFTHLGTLPPLGEVNTGTPMTVGTVLIFQPVALPRVGSGAANGP